MHPNIPHKVIIEPVLNGYLVQVGCQHLVFSSTDNLLQALGRYLEDPHKTEIYYRTEALHKDLLSAITAQDFMGGNRAGMSLPTWATAGGSGLQGVTSGSSPSS
jgi:hypothetical protein